MSTTSPPAAEPTRRDDDTPRGGPSRGPRRSWHLSLGRQTGVVTALFVVATYLALTQPVFLTWGNVTNIIASNSVVLILALGATFVILSGQIDLSTGSALVAAGMVLGLSLQTGHSAVLAITLTVLSGVLLGVINGVMVAWLRISFLVVTLGTLSIFQSFALVVNEGQTISVFEEPGFAALGTFVNASVGPLPFLILFDVVLVIVCGVVLRSTGFGRAVYAVGSNREAARINGIPLARVTASVFVIAGSAAGLASLVQVGRLTGASPQVDPTLLLTVIAAVLIGGTAYTGGEGGVLGTLIGILFLGVVRNGLTLSGVSTFWQGTVNGLILILAVGLGVARDRGAFRRREVPTHG